MVTLSHQARILLALTTCALARRNITIVPYAYCMRHDQGGEFERVNVTCVYSNALAILHCIGIESDSHVWKSCELIKRGVKWTPKIVASVMFLMGATTCA